MSSQSNKIEDINQEILELEKEMINGIIGYAKNGIEPNNNAKSFMNAYNLIQNILDSNKVKSEALFNYYNKIISDFIEDCYKNISKESKTQLIDSLNKITENINFLIYWMNKIFAYLDRLLKDKKKPSLSKKSLELYIKIFFEPLKNEVFKEVNKLIKDDRNCNLEFRPKIKSIMRIINNLDLISPKIIKENHKIIWIAEKGTENKNLRVYGDLWFNTFSEETVKFVKDKANTDIHNMSGQEYISSQLKYLHEENIRKNEYINPNYHKDIDKINYSFLVASNAEELAKMDTGIAYMLTNKRNDELKQAYDLLSLNPESLKVIANVFHPYIKKRGEEIGKNKEISKDPKLFIPQLISFKKEMDNLIQSCFSNNLEFQNTKNRSFIKFMNNVLYAKQLSNYTDFCMRKYFKGKSEEEVENILNEIIELFKFLNAKLVFQIEANKKLCDRLIKDLSISTNHEKKLISKLKQESGVSYVSKMIQMINDLDKNKKEIDEYRSLSHRGMPYGIKFNVKIISQSAWEINTKTMERIELPKVLSDCINDFENFYLKKYSGQKLKWCLGLSKIDIQYLCFKNKNISTSTLIQYLTLLLLEKYQSLTLSKISEIFGCHINTILAEMPGLVYNPSFNSKGKKEKGLILGNFDDKKVFKETDEISFNINFTISVQKFQTISLSLKKSQAEIKEAELEEAQILKKYQDNILQATLTRIMKSRNGQKTTHIWLISEASKQIDLFKAQPHQIKENIEKLIEKNIIKREEKDKSCYEYIA